MYLTEKYHLPTFSPFRSVGKPSVSKNLDLISRSFDENLIKRLKTLNSPSISLSWLSLAVHFLSSTHDEAQTLISTLKSSSDESMSLYLNHSVKLLDICNLISSEIERLRQRRIIVNFILHLVGVSGDEFHVPAKDKLVRARNSISDWEKSNNTRGLANRRGFHIQDPEALLRDLASAIGVAPRGKLSTVGKVIHRTIYAVGLVTVFVAGVVLSAMYGLPEISKVQVPSEFLWADEFNGLQTEIFAKMERRVFVLTEFDDVATRLKGVSDVIESDVVLGSNEEVKKERLESVVKELVTVTERFSQRLDSLCDGVNGMFNKVLCTRNGVLENFRVGPSKKQEKCK